jgi:hypothetical protein
MLNVLPPFVDRHAGTDREDQDRDHERPEIQFATIAERMRCVGGSLGTMLAVDHGVNPLGQHRRRSGECGSDELRHANPQVRR